MKLDNPAAAAEVWASRLGNSRQAYIDGVNGTPVAPGQLAAAAGDRWLANTQAALPRFKANSQAVTKEAWAAAAINKGADRLGTGATAAKSKMEAVFTKLFPAIRTEVQGLPARGTIDQNIARSAQFARKMNARKGTFK